MVLGFIIISITVVLLLFGVLNKVLEELSVSNLLVIFTLAIGCILALLKPISIYNFSVVPVGIVFPLVVILILSFGKDGENKLFASVVNVICISLLITAYFVYKNKMQPEIDTVFTVALSILIGLFSYFTVRNKRFTLISISYAFIISSVISQIILSKYYGMSIIIGDNVFSLYVLSLFVSMVVNEIFDRIKERARNKVIKSKRYNQEESEEIAIYNEKSKYYDDMFTK